MVMVSAPLPPTIDSALVTVAELVKPPSTSLSMPAPMSMEALEAAAPRVMVLLAEPPTRVSTLETVTVLAVSARVSVSAPAPRSIEPLETWVA